MPKQRILLVEDEFLIRVTLAEALCDEGYDVSEAGNAEEALAAGRSGGRIDVMLTDIQLPGGMNGDALAQQMRSLIPGLPVIFMSGRPGSLPEADGVRQMLIAKPYLPSEICAAVRRMLESK